MLCRSACPPFHAQLSWDDEIYQRHSRSLYFCYICTFVLTLPAQQFSEAILEGIRGVQAAPAEASMGSTVRPQAAGRRTAGPAAVGTVAALQTAHTEPPGVAPMSPCNPSAPANHESTPSFTLSHFSDTPEQQSCAVGQFTPPVGHSRTSGLLGVEVMFFEGDDPRKNLDQFDNQSNTIVTPESFAGKG